MTTNDVDQFVNKWNGKGIDFDGSYGYQLNVPVLLFSFFTSFYGFFTSLKSTEMNLTVVNLNNGTPFTPFFIPPNTSYARSVIGTNATVTKICRVFSNPKVTLPVVERIKVYMVNVVTLLGTSYKSVQINNSIRCAFLKVRLSSIKSNIPLATTVIKLLRKFISKIVKFTNKLTMFTANYHKFFHIYIISGDSHYYKELLV